MMKRRITNTIGIALIVLGCLFTSAHSGVASVAGVYIQNHDLKQYLQLSEDGTFLRNDVGGRSGRYTIDGSHIMFHVEGEQPIAVPFDGNTITTPEGIRFRKYTMPSTPKEARQTLKNAGIEFSPETFLESTRDGHVLITKIFLTAGVDENARDDALLVATFYIRPEMIQLLKRHGARLDDARKCTLTKARIRAIGTALQTYVVDFNVFPTAEYGPVNAILFQDDPKDGLTKDYYNGAPGRDGWDTDLMYRSDSKTYILKSLGADKVEGDGSGEFDSDIVFKDGQFIAPKALEGTL